MLTQNNHQYQIHICFTLESVEESWVMVLLKEMYLKSLNQEKNTQMATMLLNWVCQ